MSFRYSRIQRSPIAMMGHQRHGQSSLHAPLFNSPDLTFGPESFEPDWDDIPPNPQFNPPDLTFGPESFEPSWDDIPPNPQFNPPDISFTEQFDASWDGVP